MFGRFLLPIVRHSLDALARELAQRLLSEGRSRKEVAKALAEDLGLARNAAYRVAMDVE